MNIRIGGDEDRSVLTALREIAETGQSRTPVSDTEPRGRADGGKGVVIRLSPEARKYLGAQSDDNRQPGDTRGDGAKAAGASVPGGTAGTDAARGAAKGPNGKEGDGAMPGAVKELTPEDRDTVQKLQARDAEVRAHEAAHMAAAGGHGSGASYDYQTGPDGRRYAVGGEVQVQIPSGGSPDEMMRNAQTMRAAALAPADPSSQDMAVAAQAAQMEVQARQQKEIERQENLPQPRSRDQLDPLGKDTGKDDQGEALETDPLKVFSALKSERMAVQGGNFGHPHTLSSCGFCSSAASRYV